MIDEDAHKRILRTLDGAADQGKVLSGHRRRADEGYFVAAHGGGGGRPRRPHRPRRDLRPGAHRAAGRDIDEALALANGTDYALTAGIYSRSPVRHRPGRGRAAGGNVYVNRHITGAVVGRQPFGGYGLSGIGSKAGGPDYLLQFLDPRVVTENTLRQGFAPDS